MEFEATDTNVDQLYPNQKSMAMMSLDKSLIDRSTIPNTVTTYNTSGGLTMIDDRLLQLAEVAATSVI